MAVDADTAGELTPIGSEAVDAADACTPGDEEPVPRRRSEIRLAMMLGALAVGAMAGLTGWLVPGAVEAHQAQDARNLMLEVGRQGAINLTTISYAEADRDVQRIIESTTGSFREDFEKRSQAFIDVVNQAKSTSTGTITEAGVESQDGDRAQVLVAVTVKTSTAAAAEENTSSWRMRITVQKNGTDVKVSNVEFVS